MQTKQPIFKKSLSTLVICIIISLVFVQKGYKDRSSFQSISGSIISIENTNERYSGKDTSKFRYVKIDKYPQPFQIFIGKSTGDFKPEFEDIGLLSVGEVITIYFEETNKTRNNVVNNLAYYIDRGSEVIFVKGHSIANLIYGFATFCSIFIIVLIILKKKGKII